MKSLVKNSLLAFCLTFICALASAQTTYYYVGGDAGSTDFTAGLNWSTSLGGTAVVGTITLSTTTNFVVDGSDVSSTSGAQAGTGITLAIAASRNIGTFTVLNNNISVSLTGLNNTLTCADFTVNSGTTFNNQTVVSTSGNLINNGTLSYGSSSGEFTFTGTAKTISGNNTTQFRKFTIAAGATISLQRNIEITGNLVSFINGTLDAQTYTITEGGTATTASVSLASAGILRTANPLGVRSQAGATIDPSLTLTMNTGNTINFNAPSGTQDVWCGNSTAYYHNIIISGSGTKRLVNGSAAWIDIRGSLTIGSGNTLDASATGDATNIKDIEFTVDFTNNGTFLARTNTVTVAGSGSTQVITMNGSNLYNLELANPTSNAASLGSDLTLTHALTFTNGRLLLGNYNFIFDIAALSPVGGTNLKMLVTNSNGEVKKVVAAGGGQFTYAIGDITGTAEYSPVTLNFTANSAVRTIGCRVVDAQHPNDGTVTSYISRYWHFSESPTGGSYTYNAAFTFVAADLVGSFSPMLASYIYLPNTTWTGITSTPAATSITVTGTSQSLNNAEVTGRVTAGCTPPNQPADFTVSTANVCGGQTGVTYTVPNDPAVTYTWSYSGTGAVINGTGNSVTVDFASNAIAGTLSVTAVNICSSTPRTIAINITPNVGASTFTAGATSLCVGATSTYIATASNSSTITYSIFTGSATINTNTGVVSNVIGNFTVRATATGTCGSPTSVDRVVTVSPSVGTPTFTAGASTLCAGATSTYTATASNSTIITYSIFTGSATINTNTGVVSNVTGNFTLRATANGACGTPTTADFSVTVTPAVGTPTFTAGASSLCAGASVTFGAMASNSSSITFSILSGGATINPSTGLVSNVTSSFIVRATATGTCGGPTTADFNVTVSNALTISQQPQSQTVCFDSPATFSVTAGGSNMQYQWQLDGANIPNATGTSYTVPNANQTNAGDYSVNVTSSCGNATSNAATLAVYPVIISFITDEACNGTNYNFNGEFISSPGTYYDTLTAANTCDSIIALTLTFNGPDAVATLIGNTNLSTGNFATYQWLFNGAPIGGANAQNYNATLLGQYAVVVTDLNGCSDTSNTVTVITIGLNELTENAAITIYPNPANSSFNVNAGAKFAGSIYTLYDQLGRTILSGKLTAENTSIDITNLAPGAYNIAIAGTTRRTFIVLKQ